MTQTVDAAPALKEIFNRARLRHIAAEAQAVAPLFEADRFLALTQDGLDDLSLMQRLRRVAEALHAALPIEFAAALGVLRALAPRLDSAFVTMALGEYVARYGLDTPDASLAALRDLTRFGSSEFAVRPFLRHDLAGTLAVMEDWARDPDPHVRRLASEGSRPRLPWSFRLTALIADPGPTATIIDRLKADPSLSVRTSVANHLNDIAKDHGGRVIDLIAGWPRDDARTAWIARHALRTLIKQGDKRALALVGAGETAVVEVDFAVAPAVVRIGEAVTLTVRLQSTAATDQRLVVDYAIDYVKASGATSRKVFKLRTVTLPAQGALELVQRRSLRDFTTRTHHEGRHRVVLLINGDERGAGEFALRAAS